MCGQLLAARRGIGGVQRVWRAWSVPGLCLAGWPAVPGRLARVCVFGVARVWRVCLVWRVCVFGVARVCV